MPIEKHLILVMHNKDGEYILKEEYIYSYNDLVAIKHEYRVHGWKITKTIYCD